MYSNTQDGCTAGKGASNASQRKTGVIYTNDSQNTRIVMVSTIVTAGTDDAFYVNGTNVMRTHTATLWGWVTVPVTFYVPSGATYKVDATQCWYWTETEI